MVFWQLCDFWGEKLLYMDKPNHRLLNKLWLSRIVHGKNAGRGQHLPAWHVETNCKLISLVILNTRLESQYHPECPNLFFRLSNCIWYLSGLLSLSLFKFCNFHIVSTGSKEPRYFFASGRFSLAAFSLKNLREQTSHGKPKR